MVLRRAVGVGHAVHAANMCRLNVATLLLPKLLPISVHAAAGCVQAAGDAVMMLQCQPPAQLVVAFCDAIATPGFVDAASPAHVLPGERLLSQILSGSKQPPQILARLVPAGTHIIRKVAAAGISKCASAHIAVPDACVIADTITGLCSVPAAKRLMQKAQLLAPAASILATIARSCCSTTKSAARRNSAARGAAPDPMIQRLCDGLCELLRALYDYLWRDTPRDVHVLEPAIVHIAHGCSDMLDLCAYSAAAIIEGRTDLLQPHSCLSLAQALSACQPILQAAAPHIRISEPAGLAQL